MDRIECFVTTGLWPERCVAGTAGSTSRAGTRGRYGWPPAALSQRRCVALAGRGAVRRPVVAAFGRARPRGRRGIRVWPASVALAGGVPVGALRGCLRGGGRWCPGTLRVTCTCRVFTRRSRVRCAPVQASVRRASGETRTVRSNGDERALAGGASAVRPVSTLPTPQPRHLRAWGGERGIERDGVRRTRSLTSLRRNRNHEPPSGEAGNDASIALATSRCPSARSRACAM